MAASKLEKESVWDYPRPPRLEPARRRARVQFEGIWVADSQQALRVLETSHPPTYYLPPKDIQMELLVPVPGYTTFCEWKGRAHYYDLVVGDRRVANAAWHYPEPTGGFGALANYVSFYPSKVSACYLDEELVQSQDGGFYGGWISKEIEGPFKGAAGTSGW